MKSYKC